MRVIEDAWPRQPRREHAAKSLKYMALIVLDRPLTFTLLVRLPAWSAWTSTGSSRKRCERSKRALAGTPTGFSRWLRRRPSTPLLALLGRRLGRFDAARSTRDAAQVRSWRPLFRPTSSVPVEVSLTRRTGSSPSSPRIQATRSRARGRRFRRSTGTSAIQVVEPPSGRDDIDQTEARRLMAGIVFLPVYPELSDATLTRLATSVGRAELRAARLPSPKRARSRHDRPASWKLSSGSRRSASTCSSSEPESPAPASHMTWLARGRASTRRRG